MAKKSKKTKKSGTKVKRSGATSRGGVNSISLAAPLMKKLTEAGKNKAGVKKLAAKLITSGLKEMAT